ncbi:hypothetical protein IM792_07150 [Mucilaginibacter sp. JRF]|uniref:hypothetical protein n=1 Tax=Mucilaginibacter sp. JRF TaxID=2780088 RepID=UPI00188090FC|nr:hypothetical protein [Mucilaginibacter sp. JRF]MBE9584220.1 hypothetical protein [Mucilaginibacter sp. JRF]
MGTYFKLQTDITELKSQQEAQSRVNEIRLKVLEEQVALLQEQMKEVTINRTK